MKTSLFILLFCFAQMAWASPGTISQFIKIDQFGYLCSSKKVAVIVDPQTGYNSADAFNPGTGTNQYQVRRWSDDVAVFTGTLQVWNSGNTHAQSGDKGWWFDFSSVTTTGSYYIYDVANNVGSYRFEIGNNVYSEVLKHAMRMFFYQRIGQAKTTTNSDVKWTDSAWYTGANQDGAARSRWDKTNNATAKNLSGGWIDAGDPNKYTTFAQDVLIDLLEAYRMNPSIFADNYNIPESGNGIPDILDEVKYELDFLKRMQDATGTNGFFLKVGVDNYNTFSPISNDTRPRYYIPECTSATLSGCAMFALAAIVYKASSNSAMQTYGNDLQTRAQNAWTRASTTTSNFTTFETTCDDQDIKSGDADYSAARQLQAAVIAAVYLYEATGQATYKNFVESKYTQIEPYSNSWWGPYNNGAHLALLRYASLSGVTASVATNIRNQKAGQNGTLSINDYNAKTDLYRSYMPDAQFDWGSNSIKSAAGNANLDFITFNLNTTNHALYRETAEEYLHYIHGQNPQGMVYLTNMYSYGGDKCANEMYHMWFDNGTDWDNAISSSKGPAPGYLVGGVNRNFSVTTLVPPYGQPAQKAYKDWNTGYPENSWEVTEPAIYYQAAYVRLISRIMAYNTGCASAPTVPAAPTTLAATAASASQINLTWTDNANNETAYKVERATASGGPWTEIVANLAANTTSYSATGLSASTIYYFRVRCSNSNGNSNYSGTANATTSGTGNSLVIRARGNCGTETMELRINDAVVQTWTNVSTTLSNYTYNGYTGGNIKVAFTNDASSPCDRNFFLDYITIGSTTYQTETVATRTGCGDTQWLWCNGHFDFGTPGGSAPAAPSSLGATASSSNQINLSWTDNASNETAYKVERATASGGPWTEIVANLAANTTSYSATGLSAATTYYFRVRASNTNGNSAYSNTANATTQAATTSTYIYADALAADWNNWSWGGTATFNNTSPVFAGSNSARMNFTDAFGGFSLQKGTAIGTSNLTEIRFRIYATAIRSLNFSTQSADNSGNSTTVAISTTANQWTEIVITKAQLGNPTAIKRLNVQANNFTGDVYFDEIRYVTNSSFAGNDDMSLFQTNRPKPLMSTGLKAFPNPVTEQVTLDFVLAKNEEIQISVHDVSGRKVQEHKMSAVRGQNRQQLNLNGLPSGLYWIKLEGNEQVLTEKIMKQ
jgi:hypothetical protein